MAKNLGLIGPAGSGKGIAAEYLARKFKYNVISMGDIVRAVAKKEHLLPTRENLEKLQAKYSKQYGQDFVIGHALEKASKIRGPIILDGIRKPIQAKLAKQTLKAKLILINADPEIRFERMKKRRRKSGFSKTFEDFKKLEKKEDKVFNLRKTCSMADYKVDNSRDQKWLYSQLDKVMGKINR